MWGICFMLLVPLPSSYQNSVIFFLSRHGMLSLHPLSMLKFSMSWTCLHFVHGASTAVNSSVQLPCYVQTTLPLYSHQLPLALIIFLPPLLSQYPWALGGVKDWHSSLLFFTLWLLVSLCVNHHLLQNEASMMKVNQRTNIWILWWASSSWFIISIY